MTRAGGSRRATAALLLWLVFLALPQGARGGEFESGGAALAGSHVLDTAASLFPLAQRGDEAARMKLLDIAEDCRRGAVGSQQCTRAVTILRRLVEMGHLPAFVNLGSLYSQGCAEVAADPVAGFRLTREAAEKGDLVGQVALGAMYVNGVGVARDHGEAMRWYRRAADRGSAQAQFDVGLMYYKGEGVRRDLGEAERWFALAAAQGSERAKNGLLSIATMHAAGVGGPQQCARAEAIMRNLAEAGYDPASVHLGGLYLRGCAEVPANVAEGIRLVRTHAERGDPTAQAQLGWAYATGTGVPQDFGEAMRWSRMAADQGSSLGQAYVGMLYAFGQGVARDLAEAKRWLGLAAAQHDERAAAMLARVEAADNQDPRSIALHADARGVAADALAWRYVHQVAALRALRVVESGVTLQLPEGPVSRQNLEEVRADLLRRTAIDAGVIRERGSRDVSGRYRATADPACGQSKSVWAGGIAMREVHEVELWQDGPSATLRQYGRTGEEVGLRVDAVVVESSLAFPDPMNMDYALIGAFDAGTIVVRPDVDVVLRAWPAWAGPPSREALAACAVTLTRREDAAVHEAPPRGKTSPPMAEGPFGAALLARDYADVAAKRKIAAMLISGEMVRLPEKPNAKQEYEREKQALDAREAGLGAEIRARGFANVAGRYRATAPAACRQIGAPWAAAVAGGNVRDIDVSQDGFVATLAERRPRGYTATAIVVESTLVMTNPMGGPRAFVGAVENDVIRMHADVDSRPTRPSAMVSGTPPAQALAECVVTLTRVPK